LYSYEINSKPGFRNYLRGGEEEEKGEQILVFDFYYYSTYM
jgi:hypothetical protein